MLKLTAEDKDTIYTALLNEVQREVRRANEARSLGNTATERRIRNRIRALDVVRRKMSS